MGQRRGGALAAIGIAATAATTAQILGWQDDPGESEQPLVLPELRPVPDLSLTPLKLAEVREMALAHAVGNKVEEADRRGDLFEKRRDLAAAWASYVGGAKVVRFPARQSA